MINLEVKYKNTENRFVNGRLCKCMSVAQKFLTGTPGAGGLGLAGLWGRTGGVGTDVSPCIWARRSLMMLLRSPNVGRSSALDWRRKEVK